MSLRDPVHVHDLNATILHCFGIDHTRLTFKFQGRYYRLTDVEGKVVEKILGMKPGPRWRIIHRFSRA